MKSFLTVILTALLAFSAPVYADNHDKAAPETKEVCVDVQGKDGKPVIDPKTKKPKQQCTKVKVHKKFEGTKIEDAKKK